jgi:hypothetical protein
LPVWRAAAAASLLPVTASETRREAEGVGTSELQHSEVVEHGLNRVAAKQIKSLWKQTTWTFCQPMVQAPKREAAI